MKKYDYLTGIHDEQSEYSEPLSVLIARRANEGWRLVNCQHISAYRYFLVMEREALPL
jgi:hypothetical protein